MTASFSDQRARFLLLMSVCVLLLLGTPLSFQNSRAQTTKLTLVSEETSTRGIVVESITQKHEPFALTSPITWGSDNRTRIMLFAMGLSLESNETPAAVTASAEDGAHRTYSLTVECVAPVPNQEWMTSIVVRLNEEMADVGDVLVQITYHGTGSNRVRVGVGHVGDGPPDDNGAVPTPGTIAPPVQLSATAGTLTTSEVQTIIAQAVSVAAQLGRPVTVAVTDREGNVLGVFTMTGAPATTQLRGGGPGPGQTPDPLSGFVPVGLDGTRVPAKLAAISKAGTASLFSTRGNAFTSRTAGFIIQEHFPPNVDFKPGGPLYGVQFSSLPCSDIKIPGLPLGLSGDPGSVPIYKNGEAVGGVGIEGDGVYTVDRDPADFDQPFEEVIAVSAARGFEAPSVIRGDNILVDGIRLAYLNVANAPAPTTTPFGSLPGAVDPMFPIRGAQSSQFTPTVVGGIAGEVDTRFFPFIASPTVTANSLTASDVGTIIAHGAQQANITRAAIRQPLGSNARVTIAVVDTNGVVLGVFRQTDAPVFGFDVAVQKARTVAFYSATGAAASLRTVGFGSYVDRAAADGLKLDGSVAFTDRAVGFLHRPFFPDGINNAAAGPFSRQPGEWSVFNVGLQLDLIKTNLQTILSGGAAPCTSIPSLPNGIQIFPGSAPLYKNGVLVGAIGISGDGVDQDDLIAGAGSNGYAPPVAIRSDQVFVRGVRLPYLKFPRSPNL
ncbi:MAG TPA: heme-binding protein [Pyrinomonadaceae bacterium]|nr:heme-binding protein [Pyrinomonadaceae bacterium]